MTDTQPIRIPGKAPAPTNARALLELFHFYRDETGLEGLIENIDFAGVSPRQIYYAIHNRPPDSIATATGERQPSVEAMFAAALGSSEFRQNLPAIMLAAYPEKRRLLFVHIPKCAGSNLMAHLSGRFASLNTSLLEESVAPRPRMLLALKHYALEMQVADTVVVHGHNTLQRYEKWGALRFQDEVFTVIREPLDLMMSQLNYILNRIYAQRSPPASDTLGWRGVFDVKETQTLPSGNRLLELASRILRDRGVVKANVVTEFLGGGACDLAVERIVTRDVEVTDMQRYQAWCRTRWHISSLKRVNASEKYLDWKDLPAADQALIHDVTTEDAKLHRMVSARLTALDRNSLKGRELK